MAHQTANHKNLLESTLESRVVASSVRTVLAALIPVALLLILTLIRDLDSLIDPREAVRLGSTFAVFWLLTSLALVGAVLGFLWPRTGALEAVTVGGLVVLAQSLLSRVTLAVDRESLQLALYTWMIWISVCLIGAWVGMVLRQTMEHHLELARSFSASQDDSPSFDEEAGEEEGFTKDPGA